MGKGLNDHTYYGFGHTNYIDGTIEKHDIFKWILYFEEGKLPRIIHMDIEQPQHSKNICDPTCVIEISHQCIRNYRIINYINKLYLSFIMEFDIVIPLGPNEIKHIHSQIEHVRKFVQGFRRIFIVSYDPSFVVEGCTTIREDAFPFTIQDIAKYFAQHGGKSNRNTWYFQQLLKLYVGDVIPDILPHYLVIDADVFFFKPVSFFTEDGQPCFAIGREFHPPYFQHMQRLHPSFKKMNEWSGIVHHMVFSILYVKEIMRMVEDFHNKDSVVRPFWQIFIESVKDHLNWSPHAVESGASEYELYFHYMLQYHPDVVCIRKLSWDNVRHNVDITTSEQVLDYVSVCWHY